MPFRRTLDALAPSLALGFAVASLGAFAGGSDFGTPTNLPWAVTYTSRLASLWNGAPLGTPLHPVQIYAAFAELCIFVLLLGMIAKRDKWKIRGGEIMGAWLFLYGVMHFLSKFFARRSHRSQFHTSPKSRRSHGPRRRTALAPLANRSAVDWVDMIPVGYMAKRVARRLGWIGAPRVIDVYSVSDCVNDNFADYIPHWRHNDQWFFDSPKTIQSLAAEIPALLEDCVLFTTNLTSWSSTVRIGIHTSLMPQSQLSSSRPQTSGW